jgi:outer membrane protein assembly factor BamB
MPSQPLFTAHCSFWRSSVSCAWIASLIVALGVVALGLVPRVSADQHWPQWRGPEANGVAEGDSYPIRWTTSENVAWKFEIPGIGASTPVIWGDLIVITLEKEGRNTVLALDRQGNPKWETGLGRLVAARNRKASGTNPSPVTDGEHIWVYFKSGELACLDMEGREVWNKNLQQSYGADTLWWDLGTSPVLTESHVVVACMQSGPSYLVAFDKRTGEEAWKQDRMVDAPGESAQSYTTPLVIRDGDEELLIVLGADHVTAHEAKTGRQRWIVGNLNPRRAGNWRSISSPVVGSGMVFAPYARGDSLTAIRLGGENDVTRSHVAWSNTGPAADVPTPVAYDGKLYVVTDRGTVAIIEMETGRTLSRLELPRRRDAYSASPVLAAGHLYLTNEDGTIFVVQVEGDQLQLVAENAMEDFAVATPVFLDGRIYIRTDRFLHCIGSAE